VELNLLYDMNSDLKDDFAIENLTQNVLAVIGLFAIVFFIWVVIWI
jgi:hypothetical protein